MKQNVLDQAEKYARAHRRRTRWHKVTTVMASIVVFGTTYALILPAITQERTTCGLVEHIHDDSCYREIPAVTRQELVCSEDSLNIHQHTKECYDEEKNLICGYADFIVHKHDDTCYDESGNLVCTLPEIEAHTHDNSCYAQPASAAHVHTEDCYTLQPVFLVCTETEGEGHIHTADCYTETTYLSCMFSDVEGHEHGPECYETVTELTCGQSEGGGHVHGEDCYVWDEVLTCEYADVTPEEPKLICNKEEIVLHKHTKDCYDEDGNLICGKLEVLEHKHTEDCFQTVVVSEATRELICEKPEHTHDSSCYPETETQTEELTEAATEAQTEELTEAETEAQTEAESESETGESTELMTEEESEELTEVESESESDMLLETETEEESEEETEGEIEEFRLTAHAENGIEVSVCGSVSSLPYPVEEIYLTAQEIDDEQLREIEAVPNSDQEKEGEENLETVGDILFDITLWYDGKEIEPIGPVQVIFTGLETDDELSPEVYHIDAETLTAEDMNAVVDEEGNLVLDTDHFSVYRVMLKTAVSGNQLKDEITLTTMNGEYYLGGDAYTSKSITITGNTVLDLNGYGLYYKETGTLFTVNSGVTFTIKDSGSRTPVSSTPGGTLYGNPAVITYSGNAVSSLTYCVTDSTPNGTATNETLYKYVLNPTGMIIGENSGGAASIVTVNSGGTFTLEDGLLTIKNSASYSGDAHIIMNEGTLNVTGGYVCGGQDTGWGGGIYSSGTINMTGGVVAANAGQSGGGICVNGGTMNMSGGVISGNWTNNSSSDNNNLENNAYDGGGVYVVNSGTLNLSGGYITNNYKEVTSTTDSYDRHGGGGVAIDHSATMNMTGGYVTGNQSEDAAGGIFAGYRGNSNFRMIGGVIASNYAHYGEGGGLRVGGGTNAVVDASSGGRIYITNNKTGDNKDWGGGGIFIQANGYLNILDVLITNNKAGGFGGGVAGCPSADVTSDPVNDRGAAIFGNAADCSAEHLRRRFNYKDYDRTFYHDVLLKQTGLDWNIVCKDYFGTGTTNDISDSMLGDGMEVWKDPLGNATKFWNMTVSEDATTKTIQVAPLTSDASPADRQKAINAARIFVTGNYSYTHGGGIMSNGVLDMGKRETKTTPATLTLTTTKRYETAGGTPKTMSANQFSFVLLNKEPTWSESYEKYTYSEQNVVKRAGNPAVSSGNGTVSFGSISLIADGTYTYYLVEEEVTDTLITQDSVLYKIEVTVAGAETTEGSTRKTTYKITNIKVTKNSEQILNVTPNQSTYNLAVKKNDDTAAFTNKEVAVYELPETGGVGTTLYTLGGLLLMAAAEFFLLYNHKNRRKEETASS